MEKQCTISSYFDGTYWWAVIPDEIWEHKKVYAVYGGFPIYHDRK